MAAQDTFGNFSDINTSNVTGDANTKNARVGPNMVRLMFHACGTFNSSDRTGGCEGAYMRSGFLDSPGEDPSDNDGLQIAIAALNTVKTDFPCITYADLWTLSAAVATKVMGGPQVRWRPGRRDSLVPDPFNPILSHRLPNAELDPTELTALASTLGLSQRELVALIGGGHSQGHAFPFHAMGYFGAWTNNPKVFNGNEFFTGLVSETWVPFTVNSTDEDQLVAKSPNGGFKRTSDGFPLFRLISDISLLQPPFKMHVDTYASSSNTFLNDYAQVVEKVSNLGSNIMNNGFVYPDSLNG